MSYIQILKDILIIDNLDWTNARYANAQKLYRDSPGFTELDENDEIKRYNTSRMLDNMEQVFVPISFALTKHKELLQSELRSLIIWTRDIKS